MCKGGREVPLVSVAMGTLYRQPSINLLRRSVESILAQDWTDFEFLICDDGSTDEAKAFLDDAASRDARIRLVRPGECFILPKKLNACLKQCTGQFIARMDDDDFSHPQRFRLQLEALTVHPEAGFVGCNVNLVYDDERFGVRRLPQWPTPEDFLMVQPFIHPTLVFRREVLAAVGGYSEDRYSLLCEDYDLLLRLYEAGYKGMNLECCLLDYRFTPDQRGKRKMKHRLNETVTRYRRFQALQMLPGALPYVFKPLVVGLVPPPLQRILRKGMTDA